MNFDLNELKDHNGKVATFPLHTGYCPVDPGATLAGA